MICTNIFSLNFALFSLGNVSNSNYGVAFIYAIENITYVKNNNKSALTTLAGSSGLTLHRELFSSWKIKYSFQSLAGNQGFWGWGVGIGSKYFGIGAYGYRKYILSFCCECRRFES